MASNDLKLEINNLPEELRAQVADFVAFLRKKRKTKSKLKVREFGFAKGMIELSHDFDKPLNEFKNYM